MCACDDGTCIMSGILITLLLTVPFLVWFGRRITK